MMSAPIAHGLRMGDRKYDLTGAFFEDRSFQYGKSLSLKEIVASLSSEMAIFDASHNQINASSSIYSADHGEVSSTVCLNYVDGGKGRTCHHHSKKELK